MGLVSVFSKSNLVDMVLSHLRHIMYLKGCVVKSSEQVEDRNLNTQLVVLTKFKKNFWLFAINL